jgi:16S rRNA C967 or C1407 C5-methylase (RsmB/RsmF family)/NOL1/NOP2/fmu family ribosome biogenesis protein
MIQEAFKAYLEEAIGRERALVAFSAFEQPASVAVRQNPFKQCHDFVGISNEPVSWSKWGRILEERPLFTLDPHFHAGAYYVQDSSSMFVGEIFRQCLDMIHLPQGRPVRVLDLCAAPGGKTTDLAASLRLRFGDDFVLVANEVMKQRAGVLASNVALWGDPNVVVTSDDPSAFAPLEGFFDIIVADVPCSGEGMFRKDESAQQQWSENNVALCEGRQRRIIADVWPSLAKDGILVYSTCTFNRYENDGNVSWMIGELGAEALYDSTGSGYEGVIKTSLGFSLVPGFVRGEGQYCSAVKKCAGAVGKLKSSRQKVRQAALPTFIKDFFSVDVTLKQRGETVIAVPTKINEDVELLGSHLHVIASGCAVGTMKGKDLVPDADMALSIALKDDAFPSVEVDRKTALSYLHRDAILLGDAPRGFVLVRYEGVPLGFVKNLGNRCNNLHPQGRRIRMDINE